ncbi:hypothetical protein ANN_11261 [Periplaneta americana]|uniref:SPIN-DOC-like zinc-finger domain-containing protein n=1 Tax=Periplaneta americana TaxID=6978 RepID=A0ABQ8T5X8_PERAM|nr:hypothetical protein ANN_11261 [Periplaneta americana]
MASISGRQFQKEWQKEFLVTYKKKKVCCLISGFKLAHIKRFNIKRHFDQKHKVVFGDLTIHPKYLKLFTRSTASFVIPTKQARADTNLPEYRCKLYKLPLPSRSTIEGLGARKSLVSNASFEKIDVENSNRNDVTYARLYILGTPDLYDQSIELQLGDHMRKVLNKFKRVKMPLKPMKAARAVALVEDGSILRYVAQVLHTTPSTVSLTVQRPQMEEEEECGELEKGVLHANFHQGQHFIAGHDGVDRHQFYFTNGPCFCGGYIVFVERKKAFDRADRNTEENWYGLEKDEAVQ